MIGNRFLRYIKPTPPRHLSRADLFISYLQYKVKDATTRASHITPNGYGSRLLMDIIKIADIDTLSYSKDPYAQLLPMLKDLEKLVDPRNGKHTTRTLFVKSRTSCFELIAPSRLQNPLSTIPIDKEYNDPSWSAINPLRIVDMGTTDLHFSVHSGYLHYPSHGPIYTVYTIDCMALVLKFIAYRKAIQQIDDEDQIILDFLNTEIIVPTLLKDSTSIWLRNLYKQQLLSGSPLEFHTSTMWDVITTDVVGPDITGAISDILHLKRDLENQSLSPQTVLSSLKITIDDISFSQYFTQLWLTTQSPNLKPFLWVEALKYLAWWEMILLTASYQPDAPSTIALRRDILRDIRLLVMMRPWQEITNSFPFKTMVRSKIEGLYTYLKTYS